MADYTEIVKALREATGWQNASKHYVLMKQAADAIEELSAENKKLDETIKKAYLIINSLIPNTGETE